MSEINDQNCGHNCEGCNVENCGSRNAPRDFRFNLNAASSIKKIIGVVSGKGGVGKSFVTGMLAAEMNRRGFRTAILDCDITGPSQGKAFGITEKALSNGQYIFPAITAGGIKIISMNMLLETDDSPVLWRGPMVAGIIKQLYEDVLWEDIDYMFVDMPPGTSDVPLTVFQSIPLDGIIIVTSPQELVGMVVGKAINMAHAMNIPMLGLIENMAYVRCPNCEEKIYVFGPSHIAEVADTYGLPVLASIPLAEKIAVASDQGSMDDLVIEEIKPAADTLEKLGE